jgi:hypothetical protein
MQNTSIPSSQHSDEGPTVSIWAVAFLDLLGYRSVLSEMDVFPLPERPEGVELLTKAFARAVHFRQRLLAGINDFMAGALRASSGLESLPENVRRQVENLRRVRTIHAPGPDHVILACSLAPAPEHYPIRAVYNLVAASAVAMLVQLAIGADDPEDTLPLRGGIDIAPGGLYGTPEFLFSPAVTRAYELESDHAVYARIIAGDRVGAFLQASMVTQGDDVLSNVERSTSERIRGMFFEDLDGWLTLDFLGEVMRQTLDHETAKEMVAKAWKFATSKLKDVRAQRKQHVAAKYAWLVEYMRPRLGIWGVSA